MFITLGDLVSSNRQATKMSNSIVNPNQLLIALIPIINGQRGTIFSKVN